MSEKIGRIGRDGKRIAAATELLMRMDLDSAELLAIQSAVAELPNDLADLGRALLDQWPYLGVAERTAALLVLAEALAGQGRVYRREARFKLEGEPLDD